MEGHDGRARPPGRAWGRLHPATFAAIAAGGALGTCARVAIADALPAPVGRFPWATFTANVSGSFVLGFVMVVVLDRLGPTRLVRPLLATGLCGAYTTFSTLATELVLELRAGDVAMAAGYLGASLAAGLAAVTLGTTLARALPGREP